MKTTAQLGGPLHADEIAYAGYQNQTRRIAFFAGTTLDGVAP